MPGLLAGQKGRIKVENNQVKKAEETKKSKNPCTKQGRKERKKLAKKSMFYEEIVSALETAEKGARARTFPREKIPELAKIMEKQPFGYVEGHGGYVAKSYRYSADTTYLTLAWYTQSGQKKTSISAYRGYAPKVAYGTSASLSIQTEDKWEAFSHVFPERAKKIGGWLHARKVRTALAGLPPIPTGYQVYKAIREGDIALVMMETTEFFVVTPVGWIRVQRHKNGLKRSPWLYLRDEGFPVPHVKRLRKWSKELTAYTTLQVLGGETI